jgi:peroxiredoxin
VSGLKKLAVLIAGAGLVAALYVGTHRRGNPVATNPATAAALAPQLTMVDLDGHSWDTSTLKGQVVLVNFWAAWCTPCTDEVPKLIGLQQKYGSEGFQTIGISMEDKEPALRDFYRKYKMNYPVVIGSEQIAQDYGGILGLPTTFLIGRDGRIRSKHAGLADFSQLEQEIASLLQAGK